MTNARPSLLPVDQIVAMLQARVDTLVRELLPAGHRDGHEWREARTTQGGLGDSLSVHLGHGDRCGVWMHGAAGESGDLIDLITYLRTNGSKKDAIAWAKAWLGLDGANAQALAQHQAAAQQRIAHDTAADAEDAEKRRRAAHAIYLAASPLEAAVSPAEIYLAGRGLPVRRLPFPVHALRCHPSLWDRHTERRWPALIGAVTGADGKFLAAHMTYLDVQRDGSVRKAPIVDAGGASAAKRVLGRYRGGAIRLWRGTVTDPDTGEIKQARRLAQCKDGQTVDITEGIEDGLTVALSDQETRVLVAISVANISNIGLPPCVTSVVLWRQNDAPGSPAEASFDRAMASFRARGLLVADCRPPPEFKDANEMACANGVRQGGIT